jgi:photosystem II stability/assembly factor-like uncharacterized protein
MRMCATVMAGLLMFGCGPVRPRDPWQAVAIPTDADFSGVWFADSLRGWLTGGGWSIDGGIVGRTLDGGRTWRFDSGVIPGGNRGEALGRVQFRDSLNGCVTADHGGILLTDDGGRSWRPARVSGAQGGRLFDIRFLDASHGWAAGTSIVHTDDAGESWQLLIRGTSENGYLNADALQFTDESRGWLASHDSGLMRSTDGGRSWEPVPLPIRAGEHPILWDVSFSDPDHGWVAGERGGIFHTRDGGASWELQQRGVPVVRVIPRGEPRRPREVVPELETEPDPLSVSAIAFADSARGWAVGYYADVAESVVLGTSDGGATWRVEHTQAGERLRSLFVLDATHAWAAGDRARTKPQVVLSYSRGGAN